MEEALLKFNKMKILSTNYKINKSNNSGSGFATVALSLAPTTSSGFNTCPMAKKAGCDKYCIGMYSGLNVVPANLQSKINKTIVYYKHKDVFYTKLNKELANFIKNCKAKELKPAARLNCYSDLNWKDTINSFPEIQFYDYTKIVARTKLKIKNYHVTLSFWDNRETGENNMHDCLDYLKDGGNISFIYTDKMPKKWNSFPVLDGDVTDLRFKDKKGYAVALKVKGIKKAKKEFA